MLCKVFITLLLNSCHVSRTICESITCRSSPFFAIWNMFSIGFKSGDLAGMQNNSQHSFSIALRAATYVSLRWIIVHNEPFSSTFTREQKRKLVLYKPSKIPSGHFLVFLDHNGSLLVGNCNE